MNESCPKDMNESCHMCMNESCRIYEYVMSYI